uniref:Uncharacterized protein n=1 Tax=Romanomermis culicivorax TaxID=13658 RepID=A0A915JQH2_ROMCU
MPTGKLADRYKPATSPKSPAPANKQAAKTDESPKPEAAAAKPATTPDGPKPRKRVVIPYVLPWENRPAIQNQHGMGAFGTGRNVTTKVEKGTKDFQIKYPETALKSENIIPLLNDNVNLATQKGYRLGGFRDQVTKPAYGSKEIDKEKLQACQGVIPKQSGTNEVPGQAGQTPMGSLRSQVPKVHFKENMTPNMDPTSKGFLAKFSVPNPNCHAGTTVIDKVRKQVPEIVGLPKKRGATHHSKRTEAIIPKFQVRTGLDNCRGTGAGVSGLGAFRQVVTPVTGGYTPTQEEVVASKKMQPWATSGALASQTGMGCFQKHRDVVGIAKYHIMK